MEDGDFTIHRFIIDNARLNEPIYIIPFGDVHWDSRNCHREKWAEFLEWAKNKPRAYFLGMGDYLDLGSATEREHLGSAKLHDSTIQTFEQLYMERALAFSKEIMFMRGRLIGLLEGNHFGVFENGTTTTQKMCEVLKCKYLGINSLIRLSMGLLGKGNTRRALTIHAFHGKGAGRLVGGSLNTVQYMAEGVEADIYLQGHDHKKGIGTSSKIKLADGGGGIQITEHRILYVRTGSFLRGYVPGEKSYVARKAMNPTDLGVVKIEVTHKKDERNRIVDGKSIKRISKHYLDVHASI